MVHETIEATNAIVTLDAGLPGIVWPWKVTINMWAKSIGTGVILMLFYLLKKYPEQAGGMRLSTAIVSFIFLNIFLFFTLIDLHQPFRMWHIFAYGHFTSMITIGAWMASVFTGLVTLLILVAYFKKGDALYDKILLWSAILAVPVTLYTAGLMSQCTARELWQMPTESAQMILAALLAGSATMILLGYKLPDEAKNSLAVILGLSALASFILYMAELVFGPMKAEEVAAVLELVKGHGEYTTMFWIGQTFAYLVPMVLVLLGVMNKSTSILRVASVSALAGLYVAKDVWLKIPQLLPMS